MYRRLYYLLIFFLLFICDNKGKIYGKYQQEDKASSIQVSKIIFDHIQDSHEMHFFTYKTFHATVPLPIILYSPQRGWDCFLSSRFHQGKSHYHNYTIEDEEIIPVNNDGLSDKSVQIYDFSLTRNAVQLILVCIFFIFLMIKVKKMYLKRGIQQSPKGLQSWIDPIIVFVRDEIAIANLGKNKAERYMPYFLTVFFFILINDIVGFIPGSANVSGNVAFTLILALFSFVVILITSGKRFWKHILWPSGPLVVKIILIPIELIGIFTKPFSLMVRLFANMVAGHIIIICFISLIFIFSSMHIVAGLSFSPISVFFTIFIYLIELLVAFIQSFIFTNLTAVFISQVMEQEHHH